MKAAFRFGINRSHHTAAKWDTSAQSTGNLGIFPRRTSSLRWVLGLRWKFAASYQAEQPTGLVIGGALHISGDTGDEMPDAAQLVGRCQRHWRNMFWLLTTFMLVCLRHHESSWWFKNLHKSVFWIVRSWEFNSVSLHCMIWSGSYPRLATASLSRTQSGGDCCLLSRRQEGTHVFADLSICVPAKHNGLDQ